MTKQDKKLWDSGNRESQKKILNEKLEIQMKVLKSSPDQELLRRAQGAVQILEELLSAYS